MKVVINSDDFGYNKYVSDGILYAHINGIVTSTTAMVNMQGIEYAAKISENINTLGIGLHLNITTGYPLTKCHSLMDTNGKFLSEEKQKQNIPILKEVYDEFEAQYNKFAKLFNKKPTHLDSHHYSHNFNEINKKAIIMLAEKYDLKIREHNAYKFINSFYKNNVTINHLINILEENKEDIEIMCHVGYCDLDLFKTSSYNFKRVEELDVLCSEQIKKYIEENNIQLVHY